MYCDNCGSPMAEGQEFCEKCGRKSTAAPGISGGAPTPGKGNTLMLITSIVLFVFALGMIIVGFVAAGMIADGGWDISKIRSVGGKTLEEAYYHGYGVVLMGIGWLTRMVGVGLGLILAYLGIKSLNKAR